MNKKIRSFTDLDAWREAHKLVLMIYGITEEFPKKEIFCLVSQIRRAAISVSSNIAEGFSRNTVGEKCQFYAIALGSLTELQNQLLVAKDVKYISKNEFVKIANQTVSVAKLINGLKRIKNTKY
ncbi:MAG: four helix bundle protein [Parcubacteria group bacterium]|jgi:four helix bundle protein